MIEYDLISEIIKSDEFMLERKLQNCHAGVVHVNDQVLVDGVFTTYGDSSPEMQEYRQREKDAFLKLICPKISEKYPMLSEQEIFVIANMCSGHNQTEDLDELMDIDICALKYFESVNSIDNQKKCILDIKKQMQNIKTQVYDPETYSEEYAKSILLRQLNAHLIDDTVPLITWGESRLVAEKASEISKEKKSTIAF